MFLTTNKSLFNVIQMNRCLIIMLFYLLSWEVYAQSNSEPTASTITEPCFVTSYLTHQHLMVFQNRAIQKVKDVEEHLKVVRDFKYEKSQREQAAKMLLAFFVKDAQITFESEKDSLNRQVSVYDFVQEMLARDSSNLQFSPKVFKNNRLESPLVLHKSGHYIGMITYTMIDKKDPDFFSERNIVIHLQKVAKVFGGLDEDVWEVKLGNVVVRM